VFYREGRRLYLTEAGRAVHLWASDILRRTLELSRNLDTVSDGMAGTVVIGTSMSIGSYRLPPLLATFLAEHPAVEIRVDVTVAAQAIAGTEAGENDFSLVVIQMPTRNQGLVTERIGSEQLVVVAAPNGSPDSGTVTVEELGTFSFVEAPTGTLRRSFTDRELVRIGIPDRRVVVELGHPEAMKQMVAAGLGVCCLFRSAVDRELADGSLRELTIDGITMEGPIYLIHRKDKLFSAAQRDLIDALRSYLGPLPQASATAAG
jgi:DNA-binding transcriptional LysR family regulator